MEPRAWKRKGDGAARLRQCCHCFVDEHGSRLLERYCLMVVSTPQHPSELSLL
jgi:hypothetical protein